MIERPTAICHSVSESLRSPLPHAIITTKAPADTSAHAGAPALPRGMDLTFSSCATLIVDPGVLKGLKANSARGPATGARIRLKTTARPIIPGKLGVSTYI